MSSITNSAPYTIIPCTTLPDSFKLLLNSSTQEGFNFLLRLQQEFESSTNLFNQVGEVLCAVYKGMELIALGGINQWGSIAERRGRLRRFYVLPTYRQQGIGRLLLTHLEHKAQPHFDTLYLYTDTLTAAQFYQACGYSTCNEYEANFKKSLLV